MSAPGAARPHPAAAIATLSGYDPGHDLATLRARFHGGLVELGANESVLGPPPAARRALAAIDAFDVLRYPDPNGRALKTALAARFALDSRQIALGNGSHELLMLLAQGFAGPGDSVVSSEFGFAVFQIAAHAVGAEPRIVPALTRDHPEPRGHDLDGFAAAIASSTRIVFIANPNNPTGTTLRHNALAAFLDRVPAAVLVVVDEAYAEYVTDPETADATRLLARHSNLVVTRTFSKAYGLAGLRVGYALGAAEIIATIERLRESFNVNAIAQIVAAAALAEDDFIARVRRQTARQIAALGAALGERGLFVHPSATNFVLIDFGRDAAPIERALIDAGVVVRPMGGYGLPSCLRVNVGSDDDDARFLTALDRALA